MLCKFLESLSLVIGVITFWYGSWNRTGIVVPKSNWPLGKGSNRAPKVLVSVLLLNRFMNHQFQSGSYEKFEKVIFLNLNVNQNRFLTEIERPGIKKNRSLIVSVQPSLQKLWNCRFEIETKTETGTSSSCGRLHRSCRSRQIFKSLYEEIVKIPGWKRLIRMVFLLLFSCS